MKTFTSLTWKEALHLIHSGQLTIIGSNMSQINNQGEFSISSDHTRLYKRRHTASKVVFDLIAKA